MKGVHLINAGAGSGKTYALTGKVVEALAEGARPEGLMVTTFTNRAAGELRRRIRLGLLAHGEADAARRVYDGFIGTVNGICGRLLQEFAVEAGLSPALDVLPEGDADEVFRMAISSVIQDRAAELEPVARRLGYDGSGSGYAELPDWRDEVRKVVSAARLNLMDRGDLVRFARASFESLEELFGSPEGEGLTRRLEREVERAATEMQAAPCSTKKSQGVRDTLEAAAQELRRSDEVPWARWLDLATLDPGVAERPLVEGVKATAERVLEHPGLRADLRTLTRGVFRCAGEALDEYQRFKRRQGLMDFVDQERQVLELARRNEDFRAALSHRLERLMVDEFQDTSPIQLALFLELNELARASVWVGDPKQAIYGFRGTDPELMQQMIQRVPDPGNLPYSWRSRERLVEFSNAVFGQAFRESDENPVSLSIPDERTEEARGGWLESWHLAASKNADERTALAAGVRDLLARRGDLAPGDVAVLCRTNAEAKEIAANLESLGLRASAPRGSLVDSPEGLLAMAALRYLLDPGDTVALATLARLSPQHAEHRGWLKALIAAPEETLERWRQDPLIQDLDRARSHIHERTPLEALEEAMALARIPETIQGWGNRSVRMANLDRLRGLAEEYLDRCRARRVPSSVAGLIQALGDSDAGESEGVGADTVQVVTYHSAKGLEWPVVVLTTLDAGLRARPFGIRVTPSPAFDPADPLAGRAIRFWPWPFGNKSKVPPLDEALENSSFREAVEARARREARRLLYVGMTRARDGMVLAKRLHTRKHSTELKTQWLDVLTDTHGRPLLRWPMSEGRQTLEIGDESIPIEVHAFRAEDAAEPQEDEPEHERPWTAPPTRPEPFPEWPAARIAPSGEQEEAPEADDVSVQMLAELGPRLPIHSRPDMTAMGSAVHGYLGAEIQGLDRETRLELAQGLLQRWGVEGAVEAADVVAARRRLDEFIGDQFPEAGPVRREWPVSLRTPEHRTLQGWIDLLLETPEGYVVVDHKSFAGTDWLKRARESAAQLRLYRQAVEAATAQPVLQTLVHFPVLGRVVEVGFGGGVEEGDM